MASASDSFTFCSKPEQTCTTYHFIDGLDAPATSDSVCIFLVSSAKVFTPLYLVLVEKIGDGRPNEVEAADDDRHDQRRDDHDDARGVGLFLRRPGHLRQLGDNLG